MKIRIKNTKGEPINRSIRYVDSGCMLYFNNQHALLQLSTKELSFLLFLTEKMNSFNTVIVDRVLKESYVSFVLEVSSKSNVSVTAVDKYIKKLKEVGYLILSGTRNSTFYIVNPKYLFKGSEFKRKRLLEKIILERIDKGQSLLHLIDRPEDEFFQSTKEESKRTAKSTTRGEVL